MLILFLRSILLYFLVFLVLRLTGKRQVSDLQPFDLLITLMIADLASCAIADTAIPLVYSIVPILALYLAQQLVSYLSLKSARLRGVFCGSPLILVADGVLQEEAMRSANYAVIDLLDQLRSKDVFDLSSVSYAILETNGSISVMQRGEAQQPTRADLSLTAPESDGLSHMLVLDGKLCHHAMATRGVDAERIRMWLRQMGVLRVADVFFLQLSAGGLLTMQTKQRAGLRTHTLQTEAKHIALQ